MSRKIIIFVLTILVLAGLTLTPNPVNAATNLPAGFVTEAVVTNLTGPTTVAFAPDGRMFIGQKDGVVRVFQNGALLPTNFIDLSAEVNTYWDRGLMGVAVHPDFPTTPYVYLLYTYDPPGVTADGDGARVSRLLRVSVDPNNTNVALAGSEVILLGTNSTFANIGDPDSGGLPAESCKNGSNYVEDCIAADSPSHTVGTLTFGTDNSLFVSSGDGAHFNYADVRALRALSVDSLNGKILRIDPITGAGYANNPFYDGNSTSNRSKVYSLGLRNPFRVAINSLTNEPFMGDVGWGSWEEVNTGWGKNFGWPCYEGNDVGSAEQDSYKYNTATSAVCNALYAQGLSAVQAPLYSYAHTPGGDSAVIIGGFYKGTVYPSQYQGALFFSDYNADSLRYLTFDGNGNATAHDFGTDISPVGGVVQVLPGPDTNLYYVAYNGPVPNTSEVRRIRYTAGGNTPPTANASANPDSGLMPYTANFSSAGSFDPDVQTLTYAWNFGDGGTSTDQNPSHEYTVAGNYTATLTITDSQGATGSDTVAISAGNLRPVASIILPIDDFAYSTSDIINYSGTGIDHEDGSLSGASLQWDVLLHHNQHVHFDSILGLTGATGSFSVPDHGDNTWIELCLTVTDSNNLTDQDCVNLQPNTATLSFDTIPSGLELEYEGISYIAPFDVTTNANSLRDLIAPAVQGCATFSSWSDGGAATHQINTGSAPQTYIAAYIPCIINASAGTGGTITPSGEVVITTNTNASFNIAPNVSFVLTDLLVDGASVGATNGYTFNNVTSNHTIAASFNRGWSEPTASAVFSGAVANPNNAFSSNNTYITFDSVTDSVTYTSFGLPNIPAEAVIYGIQVAVEGYNGQIAGRNAQIQLSWNGGADFTTVTAARTTNLPVFDGTVILGGAADTWGRVWMNTDFTNTNFVVKATSTGGATPPVYIDQLQVKVFYTTPILPRVTLRSPRSNTITNNNLPTFWWTNVTGAHTYKIDFATDSAFTNIIDSKIVNESPYTVMTPFSDGKYYWRVSAYNAGNQSGILSSIRTFTIDTTGPATPVLNSPANTSSINRTPTFKWLIVPTAVSYEIQYDDNSNFSSPLSTLTVRTNFRRPPAMPIGTYYWRVRAKDATGNWSVWSTPFTITIVGP